MADPNGDTVTFRADTVTFLATDIEGSTAQWEDMPEAMQRAVTRHDALLRAAIGSHQGEVFKSTGDGFYAVFTEPLSAACAALAIQHALQNSCWDEIGQLRVRVALHQGTAQLRDGDYFGQTLNRAARLVNATEGGEILLSDGIAEAVRETLPPGATLQCLGDLRLRDLREPIRVYRLTARDTGSLTGSTDEPWQAETSAEEPAARTEVVVEPARDGVLRVFVLGGFRIEGASGALANDGWSRRKARQLFKCLLTRPSRRLTRDEAYELFWPGSEVAPSNLRVVMHALRHALAGVGVARPDELVLLDHDGVALAGNGVWVDGDAFERFAAPLHDAAASDDDLEAAARLYAGDFLADDLYESWTASRRDHLRRLWCDVLLELSHRRERRGEIDLAAAALQHRIDADGCDELATVEIMRLWARHGRRADALRAYQRLADALRRELGVAPSTEATRLRDGIVSGEDGQAPVPTTVPRSPARRPEAPDLANSPEPASTVQPAAISTSSAQLFEPSYPFPAPAVLAGRQDELETLNRIVERGRSGGQMIVIGGPAGIGKSAMAGAVVREARARGFVCLAGGSFEQDNLIPYGSIRDALADYLLASDPQRLWSELGSVVGDLEPIIPELRYHLNLPGSDGGRQIEGGQLLSVVSSCLRAMATRQPVLLCLDDLHAADDATIAALPYLGRQIRRLPVIVLGAYRTDELAGDHRLARLLPKLIRERMVEELRLRPLSREETAHLVADLLDGPADETLTDWLHVMTEGNPLFSEHLLLALRDQAQIERQPDGWRLRSLACPMPPPIIRSVLERRLAELDPRARETLNVAAVLGQRAGQAFGLTMLATALGTDREVTVSHLETLLDARLIREEGTGYRFEQPLLREALYQRLSVLRRTALELRVAQASEGAGKHGVNGGSNGAHSMNGVNGLHGHPLTGESLPSERC